jgi:hypothetical protein
MIDNDIITMGNYKIVYDTNYWEIRDLNNKLLVAHLITGLIENSIKNKEYFHSSEFQELFVDHINHHGSKFIDSDAYEDKDLIAALGLDFDMSESNSNISLKKKVDCVVYTAYWDNDKRTWTVYDGDIVIKYYLNDLNVGESSFNEYIASDKYGKRLLNAWIDNRSLGNIKDFKKLLNLLEYNMIEPITKKYVEQVMRGKVPFDYKSHIENQHLINWAEYFSNLNSHEMDLDFIEKYFSNLDWKAISRRTDFEFTDKFLVTFQDYLDWDYFYTSKKDLACLGTRKDLFFQQYVNLSLLDFPNFKEKDTTILGINNIGKNKTLTKQFILENYSYLFKHKDTFQQGLKRVDNNILLNFFQELENVSLTTNTDNLSSQYAKVFRSGAYSAELTKSIMSGDFGWQIKKNSTNLGFYSKGTFCKTDDDGLIFMDDKVGQFLAELANKNEGFVSKDLSYKDIWEEMKKRVNIKENNTILQNQIKKSILEVEDARIIEELNKAVIALDKKEKTSTFNKALIRSSSNTIYKQMLELLSTQHSEYRQLFSNKIVKGMLYSVFQTCLEQTLSMCDIKNETADAILDQLKTQGISSITLGGIEFGESLLNNFKSKFFETAVPNVVYVESKLEA